MKQSLVTGATGFIGTNLIERLRGEPETSDRVIPMGSSVVDLTNRGATFDWFAENELTDVEHVLHLAALYKAGDWPVHHPATQFDANLCINANILAAWARFCPRARLTSVLSYCMYPSHDGAHPESELWGTEPEGYLYSYAMTKKALLIGQRAYREEHGLDATSVVLPTVYGPHDSFAEDSHVVGALVGKFVRAVRENRDTVEVWGDGSQEREFLFVSDAVGGILTAARQSTTDVLNLGPGVAHRVGDLASMIKSAANFGGSIEYNPQQFTGVKKRVLDVARAKQVIGWQAATSIEDGVAQTVNWYRSRVGICEGETGTSDGCCRLG